MIELLADTLRRPNFLAFVALFLCGLFIAITHHNLVKKVIGLYVIQTSVLFILVTLQLQAGRHGPDPGAGRGSRWTPAPTSTRCRMR